MSLKIGTRGSRLALAQSEWIRIKLKEQYPEIQIEVVPIKTKGDRILDSPLSRIGGKGLFVKEIEDALLKNKIDLAIHSMKDLPAELPPDLTLTVFPQREDPRDALISLQDFNIAELPQGAYVATGSLRRAAQLLALRPDLQIAPLRGNVDTRLNKLESGEFSAMILAVAGLKRLGLIARAGSILAPEYFLPAIGQGALGVEIRAADAATAGLLSFLNHPETEYTIRAERSFLKTLQGGCQVPIAGYARMEHNRITLQGLVAELNGRKLFKDSIQGPAEECEKIGTALAQRLLAAGADKILEEIYNKSNSCGIETAS
ncbi:MAG: hydroxymethylbilane synthase [Desulfobacteraceae bacterium]|nr:MAG: hydroxymethylbilane synthase [Desulfobacteraceae bacterium]